MRFLILALFATISFSAHAADEKAPPTETIKVTDAPEQALFERVREAHHRAIQKGALATSQTKS
jgi:hypothetical protein